MSRMQIDEHTLVGVIPLSGGGHRSQPGFVLPSCRERFSCRPFCFLSFLEAVNEPEVLKECVLSSGKSDRDAERHGLAWCFS